MAATGNRFSNSTAATGQLFQTAVGLDVYSYLQVMLFPNEAKAAHFERILKRPNKFFTNQLIGQRSSLPYVF